jgi:glycosyltransferase involved in cell wall biosynthesis
MRIDLPIQPRIVLLHYTAPSVVGGVEVVIAQQARLFAEAGYSITILAGRGDFQRSDNISVVIIPELDTEHPEVLPIQRSWDDGRVPNAFYMLREKIKKAVTAVLTPGDVVIAHNVMTTHFNMALTSAIHELTDEKIIERLIVWCHDISRYVNPGSGAAQRHGFPADLLRRFRPDSTYVAVSSQRKHTLAGVLQQAPDRVRVIPNGIDSTELLGLSEVGQHIVDEFGLSSADLIILMPIRITRAKNIEFALQVGAALKKSGIRMRLIITGPPDPHIPDIEDYYSDLKRLRSTLALTDEVVFIYDGTSKYPHPFTIGRNLVAELYRISDLVLMPSLREGFGLPVLEAGLMDKPIFARPMPIVDDIGKGLVFGIRPGESPAKVASRIQKWAQRDVSHNLRVQVRRNYTWASVFSNNVEPLIKQVVGLSLGKGL